MDVWEQRGGGGGGGCSAGGGVLRWCTGLGGGEGQSPWGHWRLGHLIYEPLLAVSALPRLGRPILLMAPNFESWLCFEYSPMEESLCLGITSCCPRAYGQGWLRQTWDVGNKLSFSLPPSPVVSLAAPVFTALLLAPFGVWVLSSGLCVSRLFLTRSQAPELSLPTTKMFIFRNLSFSYILFQLPWWQMTH